MKDDSSTAERPLDVLIPTRDRPESLIYTLGGVAAQAGVRLRVVIADQGERPAADHPVVHALARIIRARGGAVEWHRRLVRRGIAEQRDFLLQHARSDAVLFLDDDVYMEPWVCARLMEVLARERCAFVGAFPAGLSFLDDVRPGQQRIDFWDGPVEPEAVDPGSAAWERYHLHRAANLFHVAQQSGGAPRIYKVAWVGACVLYDRRKLESIGGYGFWSRLPPCHSGEDVLVQNLLMRRYGGCAVVPSGTYHAEVPSVVLNPAGAVDGHALELLPEMLRSMSRDRADDETRAS